MCESKGTDLTGGRRRDYFRRRSRKLWIESTEGRSFRWVGGRSAPKGFRNPKGVPSLHSGSPQVGVRPGWYIPRLLEPGGRDCHGTSPLNGDLNVSDSNPWEPVSTPHTSMTQDRLGLQDSTHSCTDGGPLHQGTHLDLIKGRRSRSVLRHRRGPPEYGEDGSLGNFRDVLEVTSRHRQSRTTRGPTSGLRRNNRRVVSTKDPRRRFYLLQTR